MPRRKSEHILRRIEMIKKRVDAVYEPGNQSKSKAQAYRQVISKECPMGERTFWRYMGTDVEAEKEKLADSQLTIDFDE